MKTINSANAIRVVVRTPEALVVDTPACEIDVEDACGRFSIRAGEPTLAAMVPSIIVIRKQDGSELHLQAGWGSLVAAAGEVRIAVSDAAIECIEPMRIAG